MLVLLCLCGRILEYSDERQDVFAVTDEPVLALFYDGETPATKRAKGLLERVSNLTTGVSFAVCDCGRFPDTCISLFVEPLPGFRLFTARRTEPYEYTNEHSLFALLDFLKRNTKCVSAVQESGKLFNVTAGNYDEISTGGSCNVIAYVLPRDRMSLLFAPTIRELAHVYRDEVDMNFGVVNCTANMTFCRSVGIDAAPIVRVYKGTEYVDYEGVREVPYLVDFVNAQCGRFRTQEGLLVYPHEDLPFSTYQRFANGNRALREQMIAKFAGLRGFELVHNTMKRIDRDGPESIGKGLEMCEKLLKDHEVEGIARQKVAVEKEILKNFERAFHNQEL